MNFKYPYSLSPKMLVCPHCNSTFPESKPLLSTYVFCPVCGGMFYVGVI